MREVELALLGGDARLSLRSDGAGRWSDDRGRPLPELDGCIDVDISVSPFTNTLPVDAAGLVLDYPGLFRRLPPR